jgi:hypothetical protein
LQLQQHRQLFHAGPVQLCCSQQLESKFPLFNKEWYELFTYITNKFFTDRQLIALVIRHQCQSLPFLAMNKWPVNSIFIAVYFHCSTQKWNANRTGLLTWWVFFRVYVQTKNNNRKCRH